jgi:hypothetical protein
VSVIDRVFPKVARSSGPGSGHDGAGREGAAQGDAPPNGAAADRPPPGPSAGGGAPVLPVDLAHRRELLAERLAELQWDLGGLAYEMAIREHFRLDVLARVAAELQQVDAELGEAERLLRMERSGAAGECPACGALHGRGAVFCWQCGTRLLPAGGHGTGWD